MLIVGGAPDLTFIGTGGTQDPFEIEAGDDVLHDAVAKVVAKFRIEGIKSRAKAESPPTSTSTVSGF